jgi:hypothetical protein
VRTLTHDSGSTIRQAAYDLQTLRQVDRIEYVWLRAV